MVARNKILAALIITFLFILLSIFPSNKVWAAEEKVKLIFASGTPIGMSLQKAWLVFEEVAEKKSNGKLEIDSFHGGQLYSEISAVEAVINGTTQLGNASNQNYGRFTKAVAFMDLPYTFRDSSHLRKVLDGPIGERVKKDIEKDIGLKVLAMPDNGGARPIYNTKRVLKTPADIKGLKIRVTGSPVEAVLYKAWGASPVDMGAAETFTSLQTGLIDGHAFNWTWAYRLKHFDLLDYATDVNYLINTSILVMRLDKFNSLSPDIQQALIEAGKEAEKFSVTADAAEVEEARQAALKKGIKIYTPTKKEYKEWVNIAKSIYPQFADERTITLLEEVQKVR